MGFYGRAVYEYGNDKKFEKVIVEKQKRWDKNDAIQQYEPGTQEDKQAWTDEDVYKLIIGPDSNHDTLVFRTNDPHIYIGGSTTLDEDGENTDKSTDIIAFQHGLPYFGSKSNLSDYQFNPISIDENGNITINSIYVDMRGHIGVKKDGSIMYPEDKTKFTLPNNFSSFQMANRLDSLGHLSDFIIKPDKENERLELTPDSPMDTLTLIGGHRWIRLNAEDSSNRMGIYHAPATYIAPTGKVCDHSYESGESWEITENTTIDLVQASAIYFDSTGHIVLNQSDVGYQPATFYKLTLSNNFSNFQIANRMDDIRSSAYAKIEINGEEVATTDANGLRLELKPDSIADTMTLIGGHRWLRINAEDSSDRIALYHNEALDYHVRLHEGHLIFEYYKEFDKTWESMEDYIENLNVFGIFGNKIVFDQAGHIMLPSRQSSKAKFFSIELPSGSSNANLTWETW